MATISCCYGILDPTGIGSLNQRSHGPGPLSRSATRRCIRDGLQLDWLDDRAVGRDVPGGKSHPFLARRIEGDLEPLLPESRQVGRRDDLPIGLFPVTPHDL